jgi:hypothetical protein
VSDFSAPGGVRCASTITGLPDSVGAGGGEFAAMISTARECAWKVDADSSWVQITPATGQGETPVSVVVAPNPAAIARAASLTVNGARTMLRQDAAACRLVVRQTSIDLGADGGTASIGVTAPSGCVWQLSTTASWLHLTRADGTGEGSAEFKADANPGAARTGTVRVGDASITVTQAAAESSQPLIATYSGTTSGTHNFDVSGTLSLAPGTYRMTFNRAATLYLRGVAGGGGGGGGKRRDDGGSATGGGGGGGGGAVNVSGQPVAVTPGTTYEAVVGSGGAGGAGGTEGSGNTAGNGQSGNNTIFRIQGGSAFLQLAGGSGGGGGTNTAGAAGAGGQASAGSGMAGGAGGNGGAFVGVFPQAGSGTAGVTTGGGGGGGQSNEQSSIAGGAPGAAGGASGGAGGSGAHGGNGGDGVSDSGGGGEGARDNFNDDSAGGGGGGGRGITVPNGAANRGGGGGGGGSINTGNSGDRGGNGGAGGNGAMTIAVR